jgi:hypothetical protein
MNESYKFIIAGAMKSGTTSLMDNIRFNSNLKKINNITSWLAGGDKLKIPSNGSFCGQAPYLMYVPEYLKRLRSYFPDIKIIICLRDPSARAYSHYHHLKRKDNLKDMSFNNLISYELKNRLDEDKSNKLFRRHHLVQRGFYYDQLINLFNLYDRENVCIIVQEKMFKNTKKEVHKVFDFLNIDRPSNMSKVIKNKNKYKDMSRESKEVLGDIYKKHNEKLFDLLGYEISEWSI